MIKNQVVPFTITVPTAYGQMIVNRYDIVQAEALVKTGYTVNPSEIVSLTNLLELCGTDLTVLDVGANFGTHALAFSRSVGPRGIVHAFEPQRIIFNMLCGSVALNSLTNVRCYNMAIADLEGIVEIPQFDYSKPLNFGGIEFGPQQREQLSQVRDHNPNFVEVVPVTTLDRFAFSGVDLIKIDVEGMEMQVLDGAAETIRRCHPVLFVEFFKVNAEALRTRIMSLGNYSIRTIGFNFLCVPDWLLRRITVDREVKQTTRLEQVSEVPGMELYRLYTAHKSVLYIDETNWLLRHGPDASSPLNLYLMADVDFASNGRLVYISKGKSRRDIVFLADQGYAVAQSTHRDGEVFEIFGVNSVSVGLKRLDDFLCAEPNGEIFLNRKRCLEWEQFLIVPVPDLS